MNYPKSVNTKLKNRKRAVIFITKIMKEAHSNFIASKKQYLEITNINFNEKKVALIWKILNRLCSYGFCYILCGWSSRSMLLQMIAKKDRDIFGEKRIGNDGLFLIDDPIMLEKKSQEDIVKELEYFANVKLNELQGTTRWSSGDICSKMLEAK